MNKALERELLKQTPEYTDQRTTCRQNILSVKNRRAPRKIGSIETVYVNVLIIGG